MAISPTIIDTTPSSAAVRVVKVRSGMDPELMAWPAHDAQDVFKYVADFTRWLKVSGLTVSGVITARSSDSAMTVSLGTIDSTGMVVSVIIRGGTAGTTARIGLLILFSDGEQSEFVFSLPVVDRSAGLNVLIGGSTPAPPPSGPGASGFTYLQSSPSAQWVIVHNLGRYASVVVMDTGGSEVEGSLHYDSLNQLTLTFSAPFAGQAYLT